ncbi:MAG: ATPase, partial [Treponema sp.]|nr:ATPase [Treponema sp.]
MEELQSTEVLDREILEDARRKAQRILKTADEEAAASGKVWEKKTEKALAELKRRHEERLELGRVEIMARLPLDKRRLRLCRIDSLLHEAAG